MQVCVCVSENNRQSTRLSYVWTKKGTWCVHKSGVFMHQMKMRVFAYLSFLHSFHKHTRHFVVMRIHLQNFLISPSEMRGKYDTSVSATGACNGYIDQSWITSGTFTVQSDTRTNPPRVNRPVPFLSLRLCFLTSPLPEGRTQAFSVWTASKRERDLSLCLLEEMTHPGHATHFSFKEKSSFTTWIFIVIHQFTIGPLAFCKGYIFPVKRTE